MSTQITHSRTVKRPTRGPSRGDDYVRLDLARDMQKRVFASPAARSAVSAIFSW
jgi:hypothetical protein